MFKSNLHPIKRSVGSRGDALTRAWSPIARLEGLERRTFLSASIAGTVFNDLNGNGTQQTGEPGQTGVVVYLDQNQNGKLDSTEKKTSTSSTGAYSFTGLAAGTYSVAEVPPTGYKQTTVPPTGVVPVVTAHDYELNGSYSDADGGAAMTSAGGSISSTGYTFAAGKGPSVSGDFTAAGSYSIEMLFKISTITGYNKLIDFKNLTADAGLYDLNGALVFFDSSAAAGPASTIKANTAIDLTITRNASTNQFVAYINGVQQFSFTDSSALATFSSTGGIANFLRDDTVTGHEESAGFLDRVRSYNSVLSSSQVQSIYKTGGVPGRAGEWIVPVTSSQAVTGKYFGNVKLTPTNLKGIVFNDLNKNGKQDTGEKGIAGATVYLDTNQNGVLDSGETSMKTLADGSYDFVGLAPGTYHVAVVPQSGYTLTAPAASSVYLTDDFELNGSLKNSMTGPSLTSYGGTLSSTGYTFAASKGLSLSTMPNATQYSIEMVFTLSGVSGYEKLIDFKNRTADAGLYDEDGALTFYGAGAESTGTPIVSGKSVDLLLTRDASTNLVVAYINGVQQFSFTDTADLATFTGSKAIGWFFMDDLVTNHEYAAGFVDKIRIFTGVASASLAKSLFQGGPPPLKLNEYTETLAAQQTIANLIFGEVKSA